MNGPRIVCGGCGVEVSIFDVPLCPRCRIGTPLEREDDRARAKRAVEPKESNE